MRLVGLHLIFKCLSIVFFPQWHAIEFEQCLHKVDCASHLPSILG